ncbi:MAG: hypothetical protein OER89_03900, partial [Gemmatimonadota bacterium]|nr:hypothetical protein [Gemmatimonadota bacterium]
MIAVIELSDSFHRVWDDLGQELDATVLRADPKEPLPADTTVLILAGGGEEDRALDTLPTLQRPADVPVYVVGANPSHRFAVEAVRRGGTEH